MPATRAGKRCEHPQLVSVFRNSPDAFGGGGEARQKPARSKPNYQLKISASVSLPSFGNVRGEDTVRISHPLFYDPKYRLSIH
jgi:hypothetical protein